ncbi:MAG: nickel-responsive transcriptional regulator NikR [Candidatus Thermoplasmatota archaeon]|nr:nickel-responsive transcriptional regulator NikR [Candidatus Thermoplasmatota archaeon]
MEKVSRIGISIEPELLKAFDTRIEKEGYENRSEAVRDLLRKYLMEADKGKAGGEVVGTITFLYDHHRSDITNKLISLQHDSTLDIRATTHVHITHDLCLEVVVVTGNDGDVQSLGDKIKSLKGVLYGETVTASKDLP